MRTYDLCVAEPGRIAQSFNSSEPNMARVYDYLLGGRNNFAADREAGKRIIDWLPAVAAGVRVQRVVLAQVIRYLVAEAGLRQLIDIGTGLPTSENVHEIAQRIAPQTRVVYVDNDPVVLSHAQSLLAKNKATAVAAGDLRDPAGLLADPVVRGHLDWTKPIGLLFCGILHLLPDAESPTEAVATLIDALPPGSYVFIHHLLDLGEPLSAELRAVMLAAMGRGTFRTLEQVRAFFGDLELIPPGLVPVTNWQPAVATTLNGADPDVLRLACVGVAVKR